MHCCNINKSRRGDFFLVHLVYLYYCSVNVFYNVFKRFFIFPRFFYVFNVFYFFPNVFYIYALNCIFESAFFHLQLCFHLIIVFVTSGKLIDTFLVRFS